MFWGLVLESKKLYKKVVDNPFHISAAVLDTSSPDKEVVRVIAEVDEVEIVIANLSMKYGILQCPLDLQFEVGSQVAFYTSGGQTPVHLSGYVIVDDEMEEEEGDEEGQEISSDEEIPTLVDSKAKKRKSETPPSAPAKAAKIEESKPTANGKSGNMPDLNFEEKILDKNKQVDVNHLEDKKEEESEEEDEDEEEEVVIGKDIDKAKVKSGEKKVNGEEQMEVESESEEDSEEDEEEEGEDEEEEEDEDEDDEEDEEEEEEDDEEEEDEEEDEEEEEQETTKSAKVQSRTGNSIASPVKDKPGAQTQQTKTKQMEEKKLTNHLLTPKSEKKTGITKLDTPAEKSKATPKAQKNKQQQATPKPQEATPKPQQATPKPQATPKLQQETGKQAVKTPKQEKKTPVKDTPNKISDKIPQTPKSPKVVKQGGVTCEDLLVGSGAEAKRGKLVSVYYEGRLMMNKKLFDKCDSGKGFKFRLGQNEVISGWDVGLAGMKVGGRRRIVCPPNMAYGKKGAPPDIPPQSTLMFVVELKSVS